jgi:hypothetical protein
LRPFTGDCKKIKPLTPASYTARDLTYSAQQCDDFLNAFQASGRSTLDLDNAISALGAAVTVNSDSGTRFLRVGKKIVSSVSFFDLEPRFADDATGLALVNQNANVHIFGTSASLIIRLILKIINENLWITTTYIFKLFANICLKCSEINVIIIIIMIQSELSVLHHDTKLKITRLK